MTVKKFLILLTIAAILGTITVYVISRVKERSIISVEQSLVYKSTSNNQTIDLFYLLDSASIGKIKDLEDVKVLANEIEVQDFSLSEEGNRLHLTVLLLPNKTEFFSEIRLTYDYGQVAVVNIGLTELVSTNYVYEPLFARSSGEQDLPRVFAGTFTNDGTSTIDISSLDYAVRKTNSNNIIIAKIDQDSYTTSDDIYAKQNEYITEISQLIESIKFEQSKHIRYESIEEVQEAITRNILETDNDIFERAGWPDLPSDMVWADAENIDLQLEPNEGIFIALTDESFSIDMTSITIDTVPIVRFSVDDEEKSTRFAMNWTSRPFLNSK